MGPRDDQVNGSVEPVDCRREYSANCISGVTYPPTPSTNSFHFISFRFNSKILPIKLEHVAPGAPVVDKAGPLFPADETNIIPCFSTTSLNNC